jgi:hypothetical protein
MGLALHPERNPPVKTMTDEQLARHILENFEGPWPPVFLILGGGFACGCPTKPRPLFPEQAIAIIGYALAKAGAQVWQDKDCWRVVGSSHKKHPTHFHALFASAKAQGLVTPKDTDNDEWPVPDDVTPKEKP